MFTYVWQPSKMCCLLQPVTPSVVYRSMNWHSEVRTETDIGWGSFWHERLAFVSLGKSGRGTWALCISLYHSSFSFSPMEECSSYFLNFSSHKVPPPFISLRCVKAFSPFWAQTGTISFSWRWCDESPGKCHRLISRRCNKQLAGGSYSQITHFFAGVIALWSIISLKLECGHSRVCIYCYISVSELIANRFSKRRVYV